MIADVLDPRLALLCAPRAPTTMTPLHRCALLFSKAREEEDGVEHRTEERVEDRAEYDDSDQDAIRTDHVQDSLASIGQEIVENMVTVEWRNWEQVEYSKNHVDGYHVQKKKFYQGGKPGDQAHVDQDAGESGNEDK